MFESCVVADEFLCMKMYSNGMHKVLKFGKGKVEFRVSEFLVF